MTFILFKKHLWHLRRLQLFIDTERKEEKFCKETCFLISHNFQDVLNVISRVLDKNM